MRYFQIPETIQLTEPVTGEPISAAMNGIVTFHAYAISWWLNSPRWSAPVWLARLALLLPQFDKKPGEWVEIEDADYAHLLDIVRKADLRQDGSCNRPPPLFQLQLRAFEQAVLKASVSRPAHLAVPVPKPAPELPLEARQAQALMTPAFPPEPPTKTGKKHKRG